MTYRLSREAAEDLTNLYVSAVRGFGVAHAEQYYAGLVETLEFLTLFPLAARARPELGPSRRGHPYKAHMIFYRPAGAGILVLRVRHGSEDWRPGDTPIS